MLRETQRGLLRTKKVRFFLIAPPPAWAIDQQLDALGLTKGYGTGGVDPFRLSSHEEFLGTGVYFYFMNVRGIKDVWSKGIGKEKRHKIVPASKTSLSFLSNLIL